MIYNPKIGWIELNDIPIRENFQTEQFTKESFEAQESIKLIDNHIKNVIGYAEYLKKQYNENPNNMGTIETLGQFANYLGNNIGPGMIGEFKHFSQD
jgi:hypothetical protein